LNQVANGWRDVIKEQVVVDRLADDRAKGLGFEAGNIVAADVDDADARTAKPRHAGERQAVHPLGHDNIDKQEGDGLVAFQRLQRQSVIGRGPDNIAHCPQNTGRRLAKSFVVIDHENVSVRYRTIRVGARRHIFNSSSLGFDITRCDA
jgi:hypothetical protein